MCTSATGDFVIICAAGVLNSPCPVAACADFHAAHSTILDGTHLLQVRLEYFLGFIVRMADIVASHRFLPTDITYVRHLLFLPMRSERRFLA